MNNINDSDLEAIFKTLNRSWKNIGKLDSEKQLLTQIKKNFEIQTNYDKRMTDYVIADVIYDKVHNLQTKNEISIMYMLHKSKSKNWIIGIHPFMSSKEKMLHNLLFYRNFGFNILLYDVRGHGLNDNSICTLGIEEPKDLEVILQWMKTKFKPKKIGLHGINLGAYITNKFALLNKIEEYNVKFVISDSTYFSYYRFVRNLIFKMASNHVPKNLRQQFDFVTDQYLGYCKRKYNFNLTDTSIQRIIKDTNTTVPTLFFTSQRDTLLSQRESHEFLLERIELNVNDYFYDLANKNHGLGYYEKTEEYIDLVREFFRVNKLI